MENYGKGAIIKKPSWRDYRFETVATATLLPTEYSLKALISKVKNQNGSGSCVSQATAYYTEVLNKIETSKSVPMSARWLYPFVYKEPAGSTLQDNLSRVCNAGIVPESSLPSYENEGPPSEAYMRSQVGITHELKDEAMNYLAKKYVTWDNTNVEFYKRAIIQGYGCVVACAGNNVCWKNGAIDVPYDRSQITWYHGIYLCGYDDKKKCFEFVNSWGEGWGDKGFGLLPYEYAQRGFVLNPMTLVDLPNGVFPILKKVISSVYYILSLLRL